MRKILEIVHRNTFINKKVFNLIFLVLNKYNFKLKYFLKLQVFMLAYIKIAVHKISQTVEYPEVATV